MKSVKFGKLKDGRMAGLYILESPDGMRASVTDYGAALVSLVFPDRKGVMRDVVLGHDDASGYEDGHGHIGATVGRFANRIADARFSLDGGEYELSANNGSNCLHGGRDFYNKRLWQTKLAFTSVSSGDIMAAYAAESISDKDPAFGLRELGDNKVTFCLDSPDGDQGFPGNVHIEVTYSLPGDGSLRIDYKAVSDADTPLNLTNHSYFNLSGHESGSVADHKVKIFADRYVKADENLIPEGEPAPVGGTPFDFRSFKAIGLEIDADDEQLRRGGGYDHDFVLSGERDSCGFTHAASVCSEESGIMMDVFTDMPEMQFYTSNGMSEEQGKDGTVYQKRCAVCFETQHRPDAINSSDPEVRRGCILKAGEEFRSATVYKFSNM